MERSIIYMSLSKLDNNIKKERRLFTMEWSNLNRLLNFGYEMFKIVRLINRINRIVVGWIGKEPRTIPS